MAEAMVGEAMLGEEEMDDEMEEFEDETSECEKFVATQVANVLKVVGKMNGSFEEMKKEMKEVNNNITAIEQTVGSFKNINEANASKLEEFHHRLHALESSTSVETLKKEMAELQHSISTEQIKTCEMSCKLEALPQEIESKFRSFYEAGMQSFNMPDESSLDLADSFLADHLMSSTPGSSQAPCREVVVASGSSSQPACRSGDEEGNLTTEAEKRSGDDEEDPRVSAQADVKKSLYTTFGALPVALMQKLLPYNTNASMAKAGHLNGPQRALVKFHVQKRPPGSTNKEVLKSILREGMKENIFSETGTINGKPTSAFLKERVTYEMKSRGKCTLRLNKLVAEKLNEK